MPERVNLSTAQLHKTHDIAYTECWYCQLKLKNEDKNDLIKDINQKVDQKNAARAERKAK